MFTLLNGNCVKVELKKVSLPQKHAHYLVVAAGFLQKVGSLLSTRYSREIEN